MALFLGQDKGLSICLFPCIWNDNVLSTLTVSTVALIVHNILTVFPSSWALL